jgi:hypothetical protein
MKQPQQTRQIPTGPGYSLSQKIKWIHSQVCLAELYRLFPDAHHDPEKLEALVFARNTERVSGKQLSNGNFRHWNTRNSGPNRKTLHAVDLRLSKRKDDSGLPMNNRLPELANGPLIHALTKPYSTLVQRQLLWELGPEVTNILFISRNRIQTAETYFQLARLVTINGFVALLLLARELLALDRMVEAEVPSLLSCAILPALVRSEVVLQPVRVVLVEVLRVIYWTSAFARQFSKPLLEEVEWNTDKKFDRSSAWTFAIVNMNAVTNLQRLRHLGEPGLQPLFDNL